MPGSSKPLAPRFRTALVTGASSGIGRAVAQAFLQEGLTVYGTSRNPEAANGDPDLQWLPFDGARPEALQAFIQDNRKLLTSIDILVNNAGSAQFGSLSRQSEESLQAQLCLLLQAPVQLTWAALPSMRQRGSGAVVNISSLAGAFPLPFLAAYSAGKSGLSTFTQSLMLTQDNGVTVIDFQLGDYRTAFNRAMATEDPLSEAESRVWRHLERHLEAGPEPGRAARDLLRLLRKGRSRVYRSGGIFQTQIAPLGLRLLPRAWLLRAIRSYYGIGPV